MLRPDRGGLPGRPRPRGPGRGRRAHYITYDATDNALQTT